MCVLLHMTGSRLEADLAWHALHVGISLSPPPPLGLAIGSVPDQAHYMRAAIAGVHKWCDYSPTVVGAPPASGSITASMPCYFDKAGRPQCHPNLLYAGVSPNLPAPPTWALIMTLPTLTALTIPHPTLTLAHLTVTLITD